MKINFVDRVYLYIVEEYEAIVKYFKVESNCLLLFKLAQITPLIGAERTYSIVGQRRNCNNFYKDRHFRFTT